MTSLIGTSLLGQTFIQDPNPDYLKIDNVSLGESAKYSYKTMKSRNIGELLNTLSKDPNVSVIIYNWTSGIAYIKKGFNISVKSDSKIAQGFTTFILKNKLPPIYSQSLVGQTLFGSTFVQDEKPNWIKIDGVALGDSQKYTYNSVSTYMIGDLLDSSIQDPRVVCVVYKWSTGEAFTKTGFNLSDSSDISQNNEFSTFIVKNKIPQFWPNNNIQPTPVPTPNNTPNNFLKWDANKKMFTLNGKKFMPTGFNCYILGYTEEHDYLSHKEIDEIFDIAKKMSATTIRSHTLGISSGTQNSLRPYDNNLNNKAWEPIDYSFYKAKQTGIKLMCPLIDCYSWYNGSYGDFCKKYGIPKDKFWTNSTVRNDFKKFIYDWLNHTNQYTNIKIKDSPELGFIETGNEFNIRHDANSNSFPTEEWLRDITKYIKSIDPHHLLLHGTDEPLGQANDFNIPEIDVYTGHFYWGDYKRMDYGRNNAKNINKPYLIGEYASNFGQDWFNQVESRDNIQGTFFWCLYPHNDNGSKLEHNDGFTVHYPENYSQLLLITNHHRRLQGLPQVSSI